MTSDELDSGSCYTHGMNRADLGHGQSFQADRVVFLLGHSDTLDLGSLERVFDPLPSHPLRDMFGWDTGFYRSGQVLLLLMMLNPCIRCGRLPPLS